MRAMSRRLVRGALIVTLALVILNLALLWTANRSLRRSLAAAPDLRLQLSDFAPKDLAQLENASNYMDAAGALCSVSVAEWASLPGARTGHARPSTTRPTDVWREIAQRNALVLEILDAGEHLEHAWFVVYERATPFSGVPPLIQRRCLARALQARALLAATEGRLADAYHDVAFIFRLGDWCSQESPFLISGLGAVALATSGLETLEQVMSFGAPDPGARAKLAERLAAARSSDPVRRGLDGDRTAQFLMAEELAGGKTRYPSALLALRFPPRFYLRLEQAASLRVMSSLIERCDRSTFELEQTGAEIVVPWWSRMRTAMPSARRAVVSRDELRAHVDLGRIALEAEAHRQAHGAYPSAPIEAWSTTNTIDPISGSAYVYEASSGGFELRSPAGRRPVLSWTVRSDPGPVPADPTRR